MRVELDLDRRQIFELFRVDVQLSDQATFKLNPMPDLGERPTFGFRPKLIEGPLIQLDFGLAAGFPLPLLHSQSQGITGFSQANLRIRLDRQITLIDRGSFRSRKTLGNPIDQKFSFYFSADNGRVPGRI